MFEAGKVYCNRYGDEYTWVVLAENRYQFRMTGDSLKYCRLGGKVGQDSLDMHDLGMFDPSGGPYVAVGMKIDSKSIVRLYSTEDGYGAEVEC